MLKKKGIATLLFLFNLLFILAEDALFLNSTSCSAESTNDAVKQPSVEYSKTPQLESQQAILSTSYKRYSLCRYGELYILCEPYIVKRGDWVYKIFRSKGELSKEDFGLFMRIFKKINPKINNTNKIEPGQNITIPLKKSKKSDFKEISPGVVELPIITLSQVPEATKIVKTPLSGENTLLSSKPETPPIAKSEPEKPTISPKPETPPIATPEPEKPAIAPKPEAPSIAKSELKTPAIAPKPETPPIAKSELKTPAIAPKPEAPSIAKSELKTPAISPKPEAPPKPEMPAPAISTKSETKLNSPTPPIRQLKQFATLHNGQLMLRGKYYFPRNNGDDLVVDVSLNPLMQFKNGSKILFVDDKDKFEGLIDTIKEFWRDFKIMEFKDVSSYGETSSSMELNSANSYKNRTLPYDNKLQAEYGDKKTLYNKPFSQLEENAYVPINVIVEQDHKSAVKQLLAIANYQYTPEKEIDISVGNIIVKATPGLITRHGKPNILIVFGDIYGSAFEALKKNEKGHIVTISPLLTTIDVAKRLFSALGASTTENPSFVNPDDGRAISIEGMYINSDNTELFITHRPTLLKEAFRYLTSKEITILRVDN